jgi:hypothetical protein
MQAPQDIFDRIREMVLHKGAGDVGGLKTLEMVGFHKISPFIRKYPGFDDQHSVQWCGLDLHSFSHVIH